MNRRVNQQQVHVDLPGRAYCVLVGEGGLDQLPQNTRRICPKATRAFVVLDTGVPQHFCQAIEHQLNAIGLETTISKVTPSEKIKSFETYQSLLIDIARSGHTRVDPVIAIGGGVVGDLAGFVAASYQRGVPMIQCPTTLLAMVDASVGGKTGFNLTVPADRPGEQSLLLKNLVGAFHQPKLVVADIDVLDSLDARYRRAGLAECIKHGMICKTIGSGSETGHEELMDWMIEHLDGIRSFKKPEIQELVTRNVALKAAVVMRDEHESTTGHAGGRMLLNFGHTFGHAIETINHLSPDANDPSLAPLHHGEAVGLGMLAASACGVAMGRFDTKHLDELVHVLDRIGLPTKVAGLPNSDEVIERMQRDKKTTGGTLRVILPIGRGECEIVQGVDPAMLAAGIDFIRD